MFKYVFSIKIAVLMLFVFGVLVGTATFIENDYGTQTAQALIYKARWFEVFLAYFTSILVYHAFRYKSYKTKPAIFLFHFAFFVIVVGAAITRYVGYEGIMHIREGEESNSMVSDVKILEFMLSKDGKGLKYEKELFLSTMTKNSFSKTLNIDAKDVKLELLKYMPTAYQDAKEDPHGKALLELKISAGKRGDIYYFAKGDVKDLGSFYVAYEAKSKKDKPTFAISGDLDSLKIDFPYILDTLNMDTQKKEQYKTGGNDFKRRVLHSFGNNAIVLKDTHKKVRLVMDTHDIKTKSGKAEYIQLKASVGKESKIFACRPYKSKVGELHSFMLDGIKVQVRIGAKRRELPFSIKLDKFKLERYPGSMTPSSYASDVVLIDREKNITNPYNIYMNHILDYRNYRFFQSSYDMDEKGTILSVNHDPGTLPTYIGYLLLTLGMIWTLFSPYGRFQKLLKGVRKLQEGTGMAIVFAILALNTQYANASLPTIDKELKKSISSYSLEHAKKFATLVVQDHQGRMKPLDTFAHDVVSKISGKSSMFGLESSQILLGMIMQPSLYQTVAMIKIGHPQIALNLGLPKDAKFAKFSDFFSAESNDYILYKDITKASRKKPLEKTQYDKKLINIDERVNIAYMIYQGSMLRIFPKPNDTSNKWYAPMDAIKDFKPDQGDKVRMSMSAYFVMVAEAAKTGDWKMADLALKGIKKYQAKYGAEVLPSQRQIDMEIQYNKLGLFGKLVPLYIALGLLLLIFSFINVLKPTFSMKWVTRVALMVLVLGFTVHIIGMGIRWYIAGHAPWSNAYESIVFIAAATIFAGIILARRTPFALAGAAILGGVTMAVAHMSFINPEITNLVPVLKSYWLMIHVATIISGNGFFGLGSILSLLVLLLYVFRGNNANANMDRSIKELSNLSEMSLMLGLFLYTVGNFLGGVWANESWGRYWGWDSKETWAAVTILIYATVLHLRFIPSLKSLFVYNVAALWAYSTVLMTYFGVNYYLSGLHSYAAGDPVPIPMWVYYAIAGLFVLTLMAARNRKLS